MTGGAAFCRPFLWSRRRRSVPIEDFVTGLTYLQGTSFDWNRGWPSSCLTCENPDCAARVPLLNRTIGNSSGDLFGDEEEFAIC